MEKDKRKKALDSSPHLSAVLWCKEEVHDPVDQIGVSSFFLQIQNTTDNFQFTVGEV